MKAIETRISGLKCDAASCDYRDENVRVEEYESYLNKPCPKCGANLLTEADLNAVKAFMAVADWANTVYPGDDYTNESSVRVRVEMDGSGVLKEISISTESSENAVE